MTLVASVSGDDRGQLFFLVAFVLSSPRITTAEVGKRDSLMLTRVQRPHRAPVVVRWAADVSRRPLGYHTVVLLVTKVPLYLNSRPFPHPHCRQCSYSVVTGASVKTTFTCREVATLINSEVEKFVPAHLVFLLTPMSSLNAWKCTISLKAKGYISQ